MKSTILRAGALPPELEVPTESKLVLDFGDAPLDAGCIETLRDRGYDVTTLLARAESLADPRLDEFGRHGRTSVVTLARMPTIREVLASGKRLATPALVLELPVASVDDVPVLTMMSSLGVHTRLDPWRLRQEGDAVLDIVVDALIKPGARAPVAPFEQLREGFHDDDFDLARLDYRDNDHYVDLRSTTDLPPATAWQDVVVRDKRVPLILQRHPCAFCEGMGWCHGYLYSPETAANCRAVFSEIMTAYDASLAKRRGRPKEARPC